jgi:hypothetical protein
LEQIAKAQRQQIKDVQRFMIVFGLISFAFDTDAGRQALYEKDDPGSYQGRDCSR